MYNFLNKHTKVFCFVLALSLIIFLITISINRAMKDFNFYKNFSIQNKIKEDAGVNQEKLEIMYKSLQRQIISGDDNEIKKYFNEREVLHMKDVHKLFYLNNIIRYISMTLTLLIFILLNYLKSSEKINVLKYFRNSLLFILILLGIFGIVVSFNFDTAFIKFHEIFFNNDLWLLDPATDIMIRMLPQKFFMSIALKIFVSFISIIGIIISSLTIYNFVKKRGKKNV